jgi:hypothetical protein
MFNLTSDGRNLVIFFFIKVENYGKKNCNWKFLCHFDYVQKLLRLRKQENTAYMYGRFCIKFPQSRMKGERHRLSPLSL